MYANDKAKELGCTNIGQVAEQTGQSLQTLNNWFNNPLKKDLFDIVCIGVAAKVEQEDIQNQIDQLDKQKKQLLAQIK